MRQLTRLLRYVAPYWWQLLSSVLLMAAVGLLDAFRVLLIGPIFDRVLNPGSPSREMQLFKVPAYRTHRVLAAVCSLPLSQSLDGGGFCPGDGDRSEGNF